MSHYVPLEMSGDLWVPYQYDKDGNQVLRPDNIAPAPPAAASAGILARSPDVAALLMQELQAAKALIPAPTK